MGTSSQNSLAASFMFGLAQGNEVDNSPPIMYLPPPDRPFKKGALFSNKEVLQCKARKYALMMKFHSKTVKSTKNLLVLHCSHGNCSWRLRAARLVDSEMFEVRTFVEEHTCKLLERKGLSKQATASTLADIFKEKYMDPESDYRPKSIVKDVHERFGIKISYHQGWQTRESAMNKARGTAEESFDKLPSYLYMLERKNSGTVTDIATDHDGRFRYMFMALGASIKGFQTCIRPVLCVDGAFLKHKVGGQMLIAVALDANQQLYPVAMGVVDSESNDSWNYFMSKLRLAIGLVPDLVFVSDRHSGIANALANHFPEAHHGACTFHLKKNINKRFKTHRCHFDLDMASQAYTVSDFHRHFDKIRLKNPRVAHFLENEVRFDRWSRTFFPGIRSTLQQWFDDRRRDASESITHLAPEFEEKIEQDFQKGMHYTVLELNHSEYMVYDGGENGQVDLLRRSCSCREFDLNGIPCQHALAVCHDRKIDPYEFCSKFYKNAAWGLAYEETIYPVLTTKNWDFEVPDEIKNRKCIIPLVKVKRGRRTEKRKPSIGEFPKVQKRCRFCNCYGHNKATCTDMVSTSSTKEARAKKKSKTGETSSSQCEPVSPENASAGFYSNEI